MTTPAKLWSFVLVSACLFALTALYAAYLHLRVGELQREMESLQQQNSSFQAMLAERDEQKAIQDKLEQQLRLLLSQQQGKQQDELARLRQQIQKIPALQAENQALKERLRASTPSAPVVLPSPAGLRPTDSRDPGTPLISAPLYASGIPLTNVALGKPVTSGVDKPYSGSLAQITDGSLDTNQVVELRKGTQWVQIDLEEEFPLYSVWLWHDFRNEKRTPEKVHDVIVQVSNDPNFKDNVTTLFNNDTDNTSGLGAGKDKEYNETREGKTIMTPNAKARYVRCYSRGGTASTYNSYTEIFVYAVPIPATDIAAP